MIQIGMNEECFHYLSRNNVAIVFGNLVISMCVPGRTSFKVFQFHSYHVSIAGRRPANTALSSTSARTCSS